MAQKAGWNSRASFGGPLHVSVAVGAGNVAITMVARQRLGGLQLQGQVLITGLASNLPAQRFQLGAGRAGVVASIFDHP